MAHSTNNTRHSARAQSPRLGSHSRRGATVVEMAVVAPIFLLLLFGLVEFTRMVMLQQALTNAAREGCREAVLATTIDSNDVEALVRYHLRTTIAEADDPDQCRVTLSPSDLSTISSGTEITTTVSIDFADASLIPPFYLQDTVLRGQSTMNRE